VSSRSIPALLAGAVALALADASIVVLALPPILSDLDASVEGAAAVIGAYTLALALGIPGARALVDRLGASRSGAAGLSLFAVASLGCGLAGGLELLVSLRALQGLGAAVGLLAIFELLGAGGEGSGRRLWVNAALAGSAAGPAIGGALTELLDWRAIFLTQVPVAVAGVAAIARARRRPAPLSPAARSTGRASSARALVALALVSAALTGVLFLLVLLLISGWSLSPLAAALVVSILPVSALAGARLPGSPEARAAGGCVLVAVGVLMLAFLPIDGIGWAVLPLAVSGLGMGAALPALAGGLLPEHTFADAGRLLAVRFLGVSLALAIIAPLTAAQLEQALDTTRERGAALILDARLPPLDKVKLVGASLGDLDPVDPRQDLADKLAATDQSSATPRGQSAFRRLEERADETLAAGIDDAFTPAFLLCGALAALAALVVPYRPAGRGRRLAIAAASAVVVLPAGQAAIEGASEPDPVRIADPCEPRRLPGTGGIDGAVQDAALVALDRAACRLGSSREELALALADDDSARAYEAEHGVNPRSPVDVLGRLISGGSG
jgi:Major Facilitator Superfamily